MTAPTKAWTSISDGAVDPSSPLDTVLMTGMRDRDEFLMEWLGADYRASAAQNHNHDGVNSAPIAGAVGHMEPWPGWTLPSGDGGAWDWCDGGTLSRTTYALLKGALLTEETVTISIASPAVVTWPGHGLRTNLPIRFFTTGALPTGITAGTHGGAGVGTEYYVKVVDGNTFQFAATPGGASINTSGTQSGVHTGTVAPHGDGDGSTTFHKPDRRGRAIVGRDDMGGTAANRITSAGSGILGNVPGRSGGAETVALTNAQAPALTHNHLENIGGPSAQRAVFNGTAGSLGAFTDLGNGDLVDGQVTTDSSSPGSGSAHMNVQPIAIDDWIIRIA